MGRSLVAIFSGMNKPMNTAARKDMPCVAIGALSKIRVIELQKPIRLSTAQASLIAQHGADCWLVNTGWSGGKYGTGKRMAIRHTRALIRAALDGSLAKAEFRRDPFFGLMIPTEVSGIPAEVLDPRQAWTDTADYDATAKELVARFEKNFIEFAAHVGDDVKAIALKAT